LHLADTYSSPSRKGKSKDSRNDKVEEVDELIDDNDIIDLVSDNESKLESIELF